MSAGTSKECMHVTGHMPTRLPKFDSPQTPKNYSAQIPDHGPATPEFSSPTTKPFPFLPPPPYLSRPLTQEGQDEVPQGRPCRHHHPRPLCRQEGTIILNYDSWRCKAEFLPFRVGIARWNGIRSIGFFRSRWKRKLLHVLLLSSGTVRLELSAAVRSFILVGWNGFEWRATGHLRC